VFSDAFVCAGGGATHNTDQKRINKEKFFRKIQATDSLNNSSI